MEDFAAGTVDLGGPVEAVHVSKAAEEQESAQRMRIGGEARTSFRHFLQGPFGASREAHLCRHTPSPSAAEATVPCRPLAFASVPRAHMPPDMAAEGITLGRAIAGDSSAWTWGVAGFGGLHERPPCWRERGRARGPAFQSPPTLMAGSLSCPARTPTDSAE